MRTAAAIERVRSFNRTVTEGIGVLDDRFLGRGRPVGESRLLWEIGRDGAEIRGLRARLGLDSGYVSRVLRSLGRQRLVRVSVSRADRRARRACLTAKGLAERAVLERRSDALADRLLQPLLNKDQAAQFAATGATCSTARKPQPYGRYMNGPGHSNGFGVTNCLESRNARKRTADRKIRGIHISNREEA